MGIFEVSAKSPESLVPPNERETRFFGPFQIIARVGAMAYRLQLPEEMRVHSVYHVSLLKAAVGSHSVTGMPLVLDSEGPPFLPEQVLQL